MKKGDLIFGIYQDRRTVLTLYDVATLFPLEKQTNLSDQLGYYVKTKKLLNPRRGIYAKPNFNPRELANCIYRPSYLSLETVLKECAVMPPDVPCPDYTSISYLSRNLYVAGRFFQYRKIKEEIFRNTKGIIVNRDGINIATPPRALLDYLYLETDRSDLMDFSYVDWRPMLQLIPIYDSEALTNRVKKIFDLKHYLYDIPPTL